MPSVADNVVSYTVIINVHNQDGSLLPGMTCAVEFIVERKENILIVPNGALRYQPPALSVREIAGLEGVPLREAGGPPAAGNSSRQQNTGLSGLMTGGGGFGPPPGGGGPGGPPGGGGPGGGRAQDAQGASGQGSQSRNPGQEAAPKTLWYLNGEGKLQRILVRTGISDGFFTEIRPLPSGREEGEAAKAGPSPREAPSAPLEGMQVILRERV
jgi:HlyD family secretion protein